MFNLCMEPEYYNTAIVNWDVGLLLDSEGDVSLLYHSRNMSMEVQRSSLKEE